MLYFALAKFFAWIWLRRPELKDVEKREIKAAMLSNYNISQLHSCFCIVGWVLTMLTSCHIPGKTYITEPECFNVTSPGVCMWLTMTGAYLFCDGIDVCRIWGFNKEMMFHHVLGILGVLSSLWIGVFIG